MLFSVRLVSRQPADLDANAWQTVVAEQLKATKALRDQGKIKAIYREIFCSAELFIPALL